MNNNPSQLEFFSNELLLMIFRHLDAQDLFRAFHNLNFRLNQLIQSFHDLHLVYQMNTSDIDNTIFPFYVHTLVVPSGIDINLNYFPNIRRLKLYSISRNELLQLKSDSLFHLEHLTLDHKGTSRSANQGVPLQQLEMLKLGCMISLNYTLILSLCPNLRYLDIDITLYYKLRTDIIYHTNLQQLIIRIGDYISIAMDGMLNSYFSCVPNLKRLSIHLAIFDAKKIESLIDCDWLGSTIDRRLGKLQSFTFYVYFYNLIGFNECQIKNIINQIEENFQIIHNNRYRSRLFIR